VTSETIKRIAAILGTVIVSAVVGGLITFAYLRQGDGELKEPPAKAFDEKQLVDRVKQAVLEDLNRGELAKAVGKGIRAYIEEQRAAKLAAMAEAQKKSAELAKSVQRVSAARDHIFGSAESTVSLIEYADFKCPYCKMFHATARQTVAQYGDKVNWVYRHLPLSIHNPDAQMLAEASECVAETSGNQGFWKFADLVYERTGSGNKPVTVDQLVPLVKEIGLEGVKFQQCLDSGRMSARVKEDSTEAARIGVTGTPGNILLNTQTGEVKVLSGNVNAGSLKAAIDVLLTSTEK
jgi:protein-disulfide isomerase